MSIVKYISAEKENKTVLVGLYSIMDGAHYAGICKFDAQSMAE